MAPRQKGCKRLYFADRWFYAARQPYGWAIGTQYSDSQALPTCIVAAVLKLAV
jgi:hypothetical protein